MPDSEIRSWMSYNCPLCQREVQRKLNPQRPFQGVSCKGTPDAPHERTYIMGKFHSVAIEGLPKEVTTREQG